jgi:O-succinylbenzoic acid--CoA ligase
VDARVIEGGTSPEAVATAFALVRARFAEPGPALEPRDPRAPEGLRPAPGRRDAAAPRALAARRAPAPSAPPSDPADVAVVIRTSGSSGRPRRVALSTDALRAHADAAHRRLGGPGRWLLALPIHHVAGWQVLVRSALAGTGAPVVLDTTGGSDPGDLAAAVSELAGRGARYTSLVPTQLVRVLAHPDARRALARLDAVLLGGAAAPPRLLEEAAAHGVRVVETYGLTETGGGCVYDGVPLDGVDVVARDGRLEVAGPPLATGYVGTEGTLEQGRDPFVVRAGRTWVRTPDLGFVDRDGRVSVVGRADDVIVTGGVKVHPTPVEHVLQAAASVAEVVVVGLPDPEWGAAVTAVVVAAPGGPEPDLGDLRRRVTDALGRAHAPRALAVVPRLPLRGPGKVDRSGAARLAADILAGPRPDAG